MHRIFMATGCYIQGPGSLDLVGEKAATLGRRLAAVCDADVRPLIEERLLRSCAGGGVKARILPFRGEVTYEAIDRLSAQARDHRAEVVLGAGGGRALDAAKGVAWRLGTPFVSLPTIASTDAAASRGIAVHDEAGRPVTVEQLARNPEFVIVDTGIIAKAPARFLRSGIGEAVTKTFEAEACRAAGGLTKHGTRPLRSALAVAAACYRLVRAHGTAAMAAAGRGEATDDLEAVVEAVVLLSCLAFENGGLSLAHALAPGLAVLRGTGEALHGDHVAYGTLVQLVFEGRPAAEVEDLAQFLRSVGLPVSLAELGAADPTDDEIAALAATCLANPYAKHQPRAVDAAAVGAAIREVERRAAAAPPPA